MPKKKSAVRSAERFIQSIDDVTEFVRNATAAFPRGSKYRSWIYDAALVRLCRDFEGFILDVLIAALNQDTSVLKDASGCKNLNKHLTDDVCELLIVGTGYFDLGGRNGFLRTLRDFVKPDHYLFEAFKDKSYLVSLERLLYFRNFAAHNSRYSKTKAVKVLWDDWDRRFPKVGNPLRRPRNATPEPKKLGSAGKWMSIGTGLRTLRKIL